MSTALSKPARTDLEHLTAGLYEAALGPEHWTDWLSSAARCFGSMSALSVIRDGRNDAVDLLSAHNISAEALRLYGEYYHQCDLWIRRASKTLMKAGISEDLCSDEEFANSELYVDFTKPHADGQFYVVGAVLSVGQDVGVIGFQNARGGGAFTREHAQALDFLLPHLQRALVIRSKLERAEARVAASQAALDAVSHGILVVSLEGRVVHSNEAARQLLDEGDGLSLGLNDFLLGARAAETNALRALIARCARPTGAGALSLPRPSGRRPFEVIVAPLVGTAAMGMPGKAGAIVFLRDPEAQVQAIPELLAALYRLTPAEGRLAADLLQHLTLEEIAARRRLSRETLRTQLKELFRKTGTSRQSELMGFVTAGLAGRIRPRPPTS
jgi:DNA-binding CsgD family transcriptional regulator